MKIVLASPLYPPDIAEPAPYIKELAKRLSSLYQVSIITYGRLPEKVPGARIVAIDKQKPLLIRLALFFFALWKESRDAAFLFIENGPSTELPSVFISFLSRTRLVLHIGDISAQTYAQKHLFRSLLHTLISKRASTVLTGKPLNRPDVLPLVPFPKQLFLSYESSWNKHLAEIKEIFSHAV